MDQYNLNPNFLIKYTLKSIVAGASPQIVCSRPYLLPAIVEGFFVYKCAKWHSFGKRNSLDSSDLQHAAITIALLIHFTISSR